MHKGLLVSLVVSVLVLAGCGQSGGLYMPEATPQQKEQQQIQTQQESQQQQSQEQQVQL
ncbi:LPS translocon maturation chaperone LptM [Photobacterium frigidiphilum]|uniref:LPS translocon maturation chaperone LptM n=1 Tax=Photobacterium frigidiphilum TaxID=264736 RepID=UPI003D0A8957